MINGRNLCLLPILLFLLLANHHLRADTLYVAVGLLNALRLNVLRFVWLAVRNSVQTTVSFKRIKVNFVLFYLDFKGRYGTI